MEALPSGGWLLSKSLKHIDHLSLSARQTVVTTLVVHPLRMIISVQDVAGAFPLPLTDSPINSLIPDYYPTNIDYRISIIAQLGMRIELEFVSSFLSVVFLSTSSFFSKPIRGYNSYDINPDTISFDNTLDLEKSMYFHACIPYF